MSRVLVIEDERKILRGLERGLRAEGYEVVTAATGEEGYLLATTRAFDCLVLDLLLPGRGGGVLPRRPRVPGGSSTSVSPRTRGTRTSSCRSPSRPSPATATRAAASSGGTKITTITTSAA
jgi:CheY-like chemotaxis protein